MEKEQLTSLSIVAGVDEVQLLNRSLDRHFEDVGLGRYFLRVLRRWQVAWRLGDSTGRGRIQPSARRA